MNPFKSLRQRREVNRLIQAADDEMNRLIQAADDTVARKVMWDQMGHLVRDAVRDQVGSSVWDQFSGQIGDRFIGQVFAFLYEEEEEN